MPNHMMSVGIDVRFDLGLADIERNNDPSDVIRTRTLAILLAYSLGSPTHCALVWGVIKRGKTMKALFFIFLFSATSLATPTIQNKGSLDPDFFEPQKDTTPTTSKGPITGTERQLVDAPRDYNQPQYESWVEQCKPKKTDLNNRAFSDCVRQKRGENREELRKKFQTVEDDQNIPLKKIPLLEDVERKPAEETDE